MNSRTLNKLSYHRDNSASAAHIFLDSITIVQFIIVQDEAVVHTYIHKSFIKMMT